MNDDSVEQLRQWVAEDDPNGRADQVTIERTPSHPNKFVIRYSDDSLAALSMEQLYFRYPTIAKKIFG